MSELFNKSKLQQKLNNYNLETKQIDEAKEIFSRWLNDVDTTKETEHQESFLREFFVSILNYQAIAGKKDNTLWWESGSVVDGKKPDGILGFQVAPYKSIELEQAGDIRVVIELKDSTVKLDVKQNRKEYKGKPVEQAFMYVGKVGGNCEFVIVSNFLEIRLYKVGDENKYHVFKLEELANDEAKIKEFFFLLSNNRLFTSQHNSSAVHELIATEDKGKEIEKKFYTHYKKLREQIWTDLIDQNKEKHYGRNFYLYKAQKLIDRIIFIRFCRENGALDSDVVSDALSYKFAKGKYYEILKDLFNAMNEGNPEIGIARFNGGLFAVDSDLDCLNISDDIISKIVILYDYNFGSDLDVNILGHIFEQSISDLADLTNKSDERKRKKDGVFYTPSYITEYIVNEAIGGWLADQKLEITAQSKAIEGSKDWWQAYAEKLKAIKIVDPACGSGAFLVKVFDYLQAQWIEVHKKGIAIDYTYKDILKNNIYGVDLNPTSVGITKLSLWLKTAHYKEPLTTLDNNIKVGNSLINNEDVAGYYYEHDGEFRSEVILRDLLSRENLDKDREDGIKTSLAFKWKEQFSNVFATGGFDVVVGNPPYVFARGGNFTDDIKNYYYTHYNMTDYKINTYLLFIEKGNSLLGNNGRLGFIIPNNWLSINTLIKLREFILEQTASTTIINTFGGVFESASVDSCILAFKKGISTDDICLGKMANEKIESNVFKKQDIVVGKDKVINIKQASNKVGFGIIKKINNKAVELSSLCNALAGIQAYEVGKGEPKQTKEMQSNRVYHSYNKKDETYKKYLNGSDVSRYLLKWSGQYISYGKWLGAKRKDAKFFGDRILVRQIPSKLPYAINAVFTNEEFINDINSMIIQDIKLKPTFVLVTLNSKLTSFWFDFTFNKFSRTIFPQFKINELKQFPIPQISESEQQPFIKKAQDMLDLNKEFYELSNKFLELLKLDLGIAKITKKLESWYNLQDNEFFSELGKQNKNLSLKDKSEWQNHFEQEKTKALELQNKISTTDNEIDTMVYALYGLNEEEIKTIEDFDI